MSNENKFWSPPQHVIDLDIKGLMGRKIQVVNYYEENVTAVIAGADPYIGVSVVYEDNPTKIMYCLFGPMAPDTRKRYLEGFEDWRRFYHIAYPIIIKSLKEAVESGEPFVVGDYKKKIVHAVGRGGYSSDGFSCPYGI